MLNKNNDQSRDQVKLRHEDQHEATKVKNEGKSFHKLGEKIGL